MPVFNFVGIDASGRTEHGAVFATTLDRASADLQARGLTVTSLSMASQAFDPVDQPVEFNPVTHEQVAQAHGFSNEQPRSTTTKETPTHERSYFETNVVGAFVGGVPLKDLFFMFKQLGAMFNAGINPVDALDTISKQTHNQKLKEILIESKSHVNAGRPLSFGFQRYPEVFSPMMVSMLRVGERTGLVNEQCNMISEYIQRDMELRNMIKRETAYPKAVLWFSAVIILFANYIIENMTRGTNRIAVPWIVWILVIGLAVGSFIFTRYGLKHQHVKEKWDAFLLLIPGINGMVLGFAMAKWGRAFAAMHKSGVPYGEGLKLAADACGNEELRARMYPAAAKIEQGCSFTDAFAETGAFSPIVLDMTRTGEHTGNVDEMLNKAAEYYEDEGQTNARRGATILGVVALLLVGLYVLSIAVPFYAGMANQYEQSTNDSGQ